MNVSSFMREVLVVLVKVGNLGISKYLIKCVKISGGVGFCDLQAVQSWSGVARDHGLGDVALGEWHGGPSVDGIRVVGHHEAFDVVERGGAGDQKLLISPE